jgi:hypothetical protein
MDLEKLKACIEEETKFIDEYASDYSLETDEGAYVPSEDEIFLILDAIHGLVANDEFVDLVVEIRTLQKQLPKFETTVHPSSNVLEVAMDSAENLYVRFKDRSVYCWDGKALEHFTALQQAESPGKYIHTHLPKGKRVPGL